MAVRGEPPAPQEVQAHRVVRELPHELHEGVRRLRRVRSLRVVPVYLGHIGIMTETCTYVKGIIAMLIGLVCGLLAVAALGVILASFFVGLGVAITTGSPVSDEIPDGTASIGVLVGLAGLMLGDEPVDRLGMLCVGVMLAVGAFIY